MKKFRTILIPTDFSELSFGCLEHAKALAEKYDAKIYLLHVVFETMIAPPFPNIDLHAETMLRDHIEMAKRYLSDEIRDRLSDISNIEPVVRKGEPWKEIVRFAQEEKIDLIVMTTHGRTGLSHAILGSVAEKVVRNSTVPVLTIKPEGEKEPELAQQHVKEQIPA